MNSVVFDSSALIAYISDENGGKNIEKYLLSPIISAVNYSEVITFILKKGYALDIWEGLSIKVIEFDEEQAMIAAQLYEKTKSKGLSLGDRACLALAIARKIPVVTADKIWSKLDVGIDIKLIR